MKKYFTIALLTLFGMGATLPAVAQQTVGLFQYDAGTTDGYTLLAPNASTEAFLIDNCGRLVQQWSSAYTPGVAVKLLENGELMRTGRIINTNFGAGGLGGRIETLDWNSNVTWFYEYSSADYAQHHDAVQLPNGNFLFIAWEAMTRQEAIAEGRDSTILGQWLWPDALIEVEPTTLGNGNIVWEWHAWDHLVQQHDTSKANFGVVADHPELIDLNYYRPGSTNFRDWLHANGIDYNETLDQIAISIHHFDEIWVIDHSTTTAEAASHSGGNSGKGGDLLYRYGNPEVYDRGDSTDHIFWGQHHVQWVPVGDQYAGQLMVFNNGLNRPAGNISTVEIWQPPVDMSGNYTISSGQAFGPTSMSWVYQDNPPTNMFSQLISGAQRLPGDHTLICEGQSGRVREVDANGLKLWEYVNPVTATGPLNQTDPVVGNAIFRAPRYLPSYPGLAGQSLTPGDRIEGNPLPLPSNCTTSGAEPAITVGLEVVPQPFAQHFNVQLRGQEHAILEVYDMQGHLITQVDLLDGNPTQVSADQWAAGMYLLKLQGQALSKRVLKME